MLEHVRRQCSGISAQRRGVEVQSETRALAAVRQRDCHHLAARDDSSGTTPMTRTRQQHNGNPDGLRWFSKSSSEQLASHTRQSDACGLMQPQHGSSRRSGISIHRRSTDQRVWHIHYLVLAPHDQLVLGCTKLGNFGFQIAHFLALFVPLVSEGSKGAGYCIHRVYKVAGQAFKLGAQRGKLGAQRGNFLTRPGSRYLPFVPLLVTLHLLFGMGTRLGTLSGVHAPSVKLIQALRPQYFEFVPPPLIRIHFSAPFNMPRSFIGLFLGFDSR
jgi:hypothetical protein